MKRITLLLMLLASPAWAQHRYVAPPTATITGGSCTNQVVTSLDTSGAPTCTTVTGTSTDNTIAKTGTDVNTSNQVTVTHLAAALPVNQGGTGLATLTAHALYVGNGTTAPNALAVCGTGTYVRGAAAADPVCSTLVLPNAATTGDLLAATSSNTVGNITAVAAGSYLRSAGTTTLPVWSTLILPNAATTGDLLAATSTNTVGSITAVAAGSFLRSAGTTTLPAWSTLTIPNTGTAGTILVVTTSNTVTAVAPAWTTAQPANQTGNATATFKMNGLGSAAAPCTITPVATGRVKFTVTGTLVQNTTADGVTWKLVEGTGTAPANAAAASGTVISATGTWTALTGMLSVPFTAEGIATGLTLSTAVWFDLQVADVTGGTASVTGVTCVATEG